MHLVGEATEVLNEDGIVDQPLFTLTIRAKPADIPGNIEVDVSNLRIGDTIRVADLRLPAGVETEQGPDEPVAVGQPPRVEEVPEVPEGEEAELEEGAEGAAPAEGEAGATGESAEGEKAESGSEG